MQNPNHLCVYCGQPANYQFKNGKWCCSKRNSSCPAIKKQISSKIKIVWDDLKNQGLSVLKDKNNEKEKIVPNICAYCGKPAQYQLKNGKWCCCQSYNQCPELRRKNKNTIINLYQTEKLSQKIIQQNRTSESLMRQGWSKGKTKFTDDRLKKRGEKLSNRYQNNELLPPLIKNYLTIKNDEEGEKIYKNKILKGFKRGWYKGYWCDSSWELAYVIYNLEHDIKFERNILGFNYIDSDGKRRHYYPDFIIDRNLL